MMSIDLNAPEVQEAIKKAVDSAVEASTKPLLDKRDELLGELKKARKESAIKPEDLEKVEQERDELKSLLTTAQKEAKTAKDSEAKALKSLETEAGFNHRLLVDNGLTDALTKAGVTNPAFLKAVKSTLSTQVQIVADGDNKVAKAGDKTLSDFVTEWAKSDEGKHFVSAPNNSGGGSQGGGGQPNTKTMPRAQFDALDHSSRSEFAKSGGKVTD
jgi:hypothetical protein